MPEVDNQGYVFNSRYLEIADAALTEFLREGGYTLAGLLRDGFDPSVVETGVRYRAPARLDDVLVVNARCARVGTSSFDMLFTFLRSGDEVAEIRTVYVNVDAAAERSRPIPDHLASYLREQAGMDLPGGSGLAPNAGSGNDAALHA